MLALVFVVAVCGTPDPCVEFVAIFSTPVVSIVSSGVDFFSLMVVGMLVVEATATELRTSGCFRVAELTVA